jgi:hypothetical protein
LPRWGSTTRRWRRPASCSRARGSNRSKGARVRFSGGKRTVTDGPFVETKELIAGFWMIQTKSKEEAIEWVKRCPEPHAAGEAEIEIRQVFEASDFPPEIFPPEEREKERQLRESIR